MDVRHNSYSEPRRFTPHPPQAIPRAIQQFQQVQRYQRIDAFDSSPVHFSPPFHPLSQSAPAWQQTSSDSLPFQRPPVNHGAEATLDLGEYRPDLATVESIDINSLTTDVNADPWQYGHRGQPFPGWHSPDGQFSDTGPMSEPSPNHGFCDEMMSVPEGSEAIDMACLQLFPSSAPGLGFDTSHFLGQTNALDATKLSLPDPQRIGRVPLIQTNIGRSRTSIQSTASVNRAAQLSQPGPRRRSSAQSHPPCSACGKVLKNRSDATCVHSRSPIGLHDSNTP